VQVGGTVWQQQQQLNMTVGLSDDGMLTVAMCCITKP